MPLALRLGCYSGPCCHDVHRTCMRLHSVMYNLHPEESTLSCAHLEHYKTLSEAEDSRTHRSNSRKQDIHYQEGVFNCENIPMSHTTLQCLPVMSGSGITACAAVSKRRGAMYPVNTYRLSCTKRHSKQMFCPALLQRQKPLPFQANVMLHLTSLFC